MEKALHNELEEIHTYKTEKYCTYHWEDPSITSNVYWSELQPNHNQIFSAKEHRKIKYNKQ